MILLLTPNGVITGLMSTLTLTGPSTSIITVIAQLHGSL